MTDSKARTDSAITGQALARVRDAIHEANQAFDHSVFSTGQYDPSDYREMAEHYLEKAFIQVLVLLERLDLPRTYAKLEAVYNEARSNLSKGSIYDGEPSLHWPQALYCYIDAIADAENVSVPHEITRDLESIIRRSVYSITDESAFGSLPAKESDVHERIEAVLKCVFGDLITKPSFTKPLKNFEPDTGIPSLKTLIEYKFVKTKAEVKIISDQLLADTRGYTSPDWQRFLYVVYETKRLTPETKWIDHFRKCGIGDEASIIVLSGIPGTEPMRRRQQRTNQRGEDFL